MKTVPIYFVQSTALLLRAQTKLLYSSSSPWSPTPVSGLKSLTLLNEQNISKMSPKGAERQTLVTRVEGPLPCTDEKTGPVDRSPGLGTHVCTSQVIHELACTASINVPLQVSITHTVHTTHAAATSLAHTSPSLLPRPPGRFELTRA